MRVRERKGPIKLFFSFGFCAFSFSVGFYFPRKKSEREGSLYKRSMEEGQWTRMTLGQVGP